jgi:hypothetical protein
MSTVRYPSYLVRCKLPISVRGSCINGTITTANLAGIGLPNHSLKKTGMRSTDMAEEVISLGMFKGNPVTFEQQYPGASGRRIRSNRNKQNESLDQTPKSGPQKVGKFAEEISRNIDKGLMAATTQICQEAEEVSRLRKFYPGNRIMHLLN